MLPTENLVYFTEVHLYYLQVPSFWNSLQVVWLTETQHTKHTLIDTRKVEHLRYFCHIDIRLLEVYVNWILGVNQVLFRIGINPIPLCRNVVFVNFCYYYSLLHLDIILTFLCKTDFFHSSEKAITSIESSRHPWWNYSVCLPKEQLWTFLAQFIENLKGIQLIVQSKFSWFSSLCLKCFLIFFNP